MRIRRALTGGAPPGSCVRQRSFVEIRSHYPKIEIDVELGGCWRTFRNDEQRRIGSADATVLRSVFGEP